AAHDVTLTAMAERGWTAAPEDAGTRLDKFLAHTTAILRTPPPAAAAPRPPPPPPRCPPPAQREQPSLSRDSLPEQGACPEGCPHPRRHRTNFGDRGVRTPLRRQHPRGTGRLAGRAPRWHT